MGRLPGASTLATLDLSQGFWQCQLVEEAGGSFMVVSPKGG